MRIYRDQGFVIIEDIAAYNFNQLYVELIGNIIRITQLGSNRGEIRTHFSTITDGFGNAIGETPQDVFNYLEDVLYEPDGNVGAASKLVTLNFTPPAAAGTATPRTVTSTNLAGNLAWTFPSVRAIGTVDRYTITNSRPIRSATPNTNTTIICPASTGTIWRVNVIYSVGV